MHADIVDTIVFNIPIKLDHMFNYRILTTAYYTGYPACRPVAKCAASYRSDQPSKLRVDPTTHHNYDSVQGDMATHVCLKHLRDYRPRGTPTTSMYRSDKE